MTWKEYIFYSQTLFKIFFPIFLTKKEKKEKKIKWFKHECSKATQILIQQVFYNYTICHNLMMWSTISDGQLLSNELNTFSSPIVVDHTITMAKVCDDPRKK